MIPTIAAACYAAFFVLALASPFAPTFLIWRLAGLSAIFYAAGRTVEGSVHWSDQDFGYAIGMAIVFVFCCAITCAIILRLAVLAPKEALSANALIGPRNGFMILLDVVALIAAGCLLGLSTAISLAFMLSGADLGVHLDLGIAALASTVGVAIIALSRRRPAIMATAACTAMAAVAFMGSRQADRILMMAEALVDGRPWCLAASAPLGPISEPRQLGFFALPKGNGYPNLGLLVRDGDRAVLAAHWSIRGQRFEQGIDTSGPVPTCHPVEGFDEVLKEGNVDGDIYSVDLSAYRIPRTFHPRAQTDRISIRSDRLVGSETTLPEITERIELRHGPEARSIPDDAIALDAMPDPMKTNADDLAGSGRFVAAGFDERAGRDVILECLRGPYADRLCRAQVVKASSRYVFYLPFGHVSEWREAAKFVEDLFASFRVGRP
jgi:hypothetical protein